MTMLTRTDPFVVSAAPGNVFPLLCPVLEYRWIPDWRCEVLHSISGVAEEDCVFRTDFPGDGPMTWVVSRYEPPKRIEFCCFVADCYVMRLKISLESVPEGTRLDWTRRWLSLGPRGDAWLERWSEDRHRAMMQRLRELLTHYLETGEMGGA